MSEPSPPQIVERLMIYRVWHGARGGDYDGSVVYADWGELEKDVKKALDQGRQILIELELMTESEWLAGDELPGERNPLL